MDVVISNLVWIPKSEFPGSMMDSLMNRLTVYPKRTSSHQDKDPAPIELYRLKGKFIGIPRGFFIQQNRVTGIKHNVTDNTSPGHRLNLSFSGKLKEDQQRALTAVLESIQQGGYGGVIQASPGWGKTVASLGVLVSLDMSAVITVHSQFLVDQWEERIKQFIPNARVGRIQQNKCEFGKDYDISIAMMQTLVSRHKDYNDDFWDAFGVVISDEVHHIGAPKWADVIPRFRARYKIGLSATPKRKDGADDVFLYHLGPILYQSKVKNVTPRLRRVFTNFKPVKTRTFDLRKASLEVQIRHICKNPPRNRSIVSEILKAVEHGRKVMVQSARVKHLEILKGMFDSVKQDSVTTSYYIGGMTADQRKQSEESDVIFATYKMTAEALDIPALDTLFLTTPVSDVTQSVGRIMREYDGKKKPIVTDFIDEHLPMFVRMWNTRRQFYVTQGMFNG